MIANYFKVSLDYLVGNTLNPCSHLDSLRSATTVLIESAEKLEIAEKAERLTVKIMEII